MNELGKLVERIAEPCWVCIEAEESAPCLDNKPYPIHCPKFQSPVQTTKRENEQ